MNEKGCSGSGTGTGTGTEGQGRGVVVAFDAETGIATLTLCMPGKVNKINESFGSSLADGLKDALALPGLKGIVIASGHKDFCVGADIDFLFRQTEPAALLEMLSGLNRLYRSLETCRVPVVAALTGSALGGGYELALACHRRIALDSPEVQVGLPEVMLGVLPGAGGTQRLPRMVGFQTALEHILQGKVVRAPDAVGPGLVDELASDVDDLRRRAVEWVLANQGFRQPWDRPDFKFPPPAPGTDDARNLFVAACAMLYKRTAGVFPAAEAAISAVHEGAVLSIDRAVEVESRHFARVAVSAQAKAMIRTMWYHRTAAERHEGLPRVEDAAIGRVGVLGAGMMGAGLAFLAARRGHEVVLKDVSEAALDKGMAHCREQAQKAGRHMDTAARDAIVGRIRPSLETGDLTGCDLVIEAVFENLELKHRVTREIEPLLPETAIWASNTSAIPITDLARVSARPGQFIGLHFFSPVEQMPLLEIIVAEKTSRETLARSLAFCREIRKLPIVVRDRYGFYTTRVFSAYILEGSQLVAEGHDPVLIEWAARRAGMVVPPLQVFDEVGLRLGKHVLSQAEQFIGKVDLPGAEVVRRMVDDLDRPGRAGGKGFYDYDERGRRVGIWPGLVALATGTPERTGVEELARRILLIQAAEAARAVEAGILMNPRDADVGAVFGIGFAPNTGGPLAWMDGQGMDRVVGWMDECASAHGARYAAPSCLREMANSGKKFYQDS